MDYLAIGDGKADKESRGCEACLDQGRPNTRQKPRASLDACDRRRDHKKGDNNLVRCHASSNTFERMIHASSTRAQDVYFTA
jgi:hypothetical protein